MIEALARKARQFASDPILRRWLAGRTVGRFLAEPTFSPHRPPYLKDLLPLDAELPAASFAALANESPRKPITLPLPGEAVCLEPGEEGKFFARSFAGAETAIGVHRFAWLPLLPAIDPAWVGTLWQAWRQRFGDLRSGIAWHPYTVAERAINILDYARRVGLPGPTHDTLAVLAGHAPAIVERLEYFGDHHTSNHLANNGRGLFLLGLHLGLPRATTIGAKILLAEAERVLMPSGVLREGSSHYHLLLTRAYASAWLAARHHGRPEAAALESIVSKMIAVIPRLALSGGFPLVGDVSPDCPPAFLMGLLPKATPQADWLGGLDDDRSVFMKLRDRIPPASIERLAADGWLRSDVGPWSGLWHAAPEGLAAMPGHGHQDSGSFELHYGSLPVIRDPGRGAYGDSGDAAHFRSAAAHNGVTLDDNDPFPPNKPYYDPAFRRAVSGPAPRLYREGDQVIVEHHGFARLGNVGRATRSWRFDGSSVRLDDHMEGSGRRRLCRRLHTTLSVAQTGDAIVLTNGSKRFRLLSDQPVQTRSTTYWSAYGLGEPATVIEIAEDSALPWTATLKIEAI